METQAEAVRPPPFINAPLIVVVTAAALVAIHALLSFMPYETQLRAIYDFSLSPVRFHAEAGSEHAYGDAAEAWMTLLSCALLHGDWMHVLVNSGMLLAFGAPVARMLGPGWGGAARWMLVLVIAILGGSALYLLLEPAGPPAIGASGGVSGLFGAAFIIDPRTGRVSPLSRTFLTMTGMFILMNVILAFLGPMAFGAGIAWQAHAGGYIAGALLMAVMMSKFRHV
ncbi:MAG: rhomboid family intramembrane serine protease [Hyphomonadaceae bacterium]